MAKRALGAQRSRVVQEAARIICEDGLADYRLAKQKAVERLGLGFGTPLPSNADIQDAVIQYQRLFGSVAAKSTELDVTVETRDRDHVRELVSALAAEGFKVRVLEGADA